MPLLPISLLRTEGSFDQHTCQMTNPLALGKKVSGYVSKLENLRSRVNRNEQADILTNSAYLDSHDLNFSNRPVRTRMPGGVGGARSGILIAPISILVGCGGKI